MSYRRADGLYGVGWLAERLRSLDSITGVETAFHDAALRAGDDFPDALEREIAGSDLVVAMIGPGWWGRSEHGRSRIEDDDDWVVRELAAAFEQGTTVIPVVMGGADHPLASEVHPSIAEIARLHTLPFHDGRDLDTIVAHIESHLGDIDRERARLAGLEDPVEVPKLQRLPALVAGSVLAAAVGGVLGAVSAGVLSPWPFDPSTTDAIDGTTAHGWMVGLLIALGGERGFHRLRRCDPRPIDALRRHRVGKGRSRVRCRRGRRARARRLVAGRRSRSGRSSDDARPRAADRPQQHARARRRRAVGDLPDRTVRVGAACGRPRDRTPRADVGLES